MEYKGLLHPLNSIICTTDAEFLQCIKDGNTGKASVIMLSGSQITLLTNLNTSSLFIIGYWFNSIWLNNYSFIGFNHSNIYTGNLKINESSYNITNTKTYVSN